MGEVFCYECSRSQNGYVRHPWPPCDLRPDGSAIDPQPCGHRRMFVTPSGGCAECDRRAELRARAGIKPKARE